MTSLSSHFEYIGIPIPKITEKIHFNRQKKNWIYKTKISESKYNYIGKF